MGRFVAGLALVVCQIGQVASIHEGIPLDEQIDDIVCCCKKRLLKGVRRGKPYIAGGCSPGHTYVQRIDGMPTKMNQCCRMMESSQCIKSHNFGRFLSAMRLANAYLITKTPSKCIVGTIDDKYNVSDMLATPYIFNPKIEVLPLGKYVW